jgi:hypothetical protein
MAEFRLRATGQVMLEDELRRWARDNGGPSWDRTTDEVLEVLGADVVFEGPQAQPTRYQIAFRDGVEQVDGRWFTKYSVADLDDEAKAAKDAEQAKAMREQRNQKLKDTDWTQVADAPGDKAAWATYRQALRDITSQAGFPWTVNWPEQP